MTYNSPKGICPHCEKPYTIRTDGTLRAHHTGKEDTRHGTRLIGCPGSGQTPKDQR